MDSSVIDLSKYRLDTANADLKAARLLFDATEYRSSVNRSYYAIFHALRAVLALDGFDSSKHSGIISYFNLNYVKTDVFSREVSKMISSAYRLREKADYQDFYIVTIEEADEQIRKADIVINVISEYLNAKYSK